MLGKIEGISQGRPKGTLSKKCWVLRGSQMTVGCFRTRLCAGSSSQVEQRWHVPGWSGTWLLNSLPQPPSAVLYFAHSHLPASNGLCNLKPTLQSLA